MTILKFLSHRFLAALMLCSFLFGCAHYISTFDQLAYVQATSIKVDVLNLIDDSNESFTSHQQEVDEVVSKMMKAIEYEKHRPKNDISVRMWSKLIDSTKQKGIVGSYLASWKRTGTKSQVLIDEFKPLASEGFDLIAELESQKIKPSDAGISKFLNK
jgi:hypothetical protein